MTRILANVHDLPQLPVFIEKLTKSVLKNRAITVVVAAPSTVWFEGNSGYRWGRKATQPCAIATLANGSDWPPVVVIVFVFETGDVAVGHREIHQRNSRAFAQTSNFRPADTSRAIRSSPGFVPVVYSTVRFSPCRDPAELRNLLQDSLNGA